MMDAELIRRADRRISILADIEEKQAELKLLKAEDKADGYDEKALSAAIKSLRKGPEWHADQLAFELEVDTYRRSVGLTTDLAAAQQIVREAAATVPGGDDDRVEQIGRAHGMPRDTIEAVKARKKETVN